MWLDDAAVAADRLAAGPQSPASTTWFSRAHAPLSWTNSQRASGRSSGGAHRAGQADRVWCRRCGCGRCGRRPGDRGRSCTTSSTREAAQGVGEDDLERVRLVIGLDVGRREAVARRAVPVCRGRSGAPGRRGRAPSSRRRARRSGPGSGSRRCRSSGIRAATGSPTRFEKPAKPVGLEVARASESGRAPRRNGDDRACRCRGRAST